MLSLELPGAIDAHPDGPWAYRANAPVWWDLSQTAPKTWLASSGTWRVIQHPSRQRILERLVDGNWSMYEEGHSSDRLLALAAETDRQNGIPTSDPHRRCWLNIEP